MHWAASHQHLSGGWRLFASSPLSWLIGHLSQSGSAAATTANLVSCVAREPNSIGLAWQNISLRLPILLLHFHFLFCCCFFMFCVWGGYFGPKVQANARWWISHRRRWPSGQMPLSTSKVLLPQETDFIFQSTAVSTSARTHTRTHGWTIRGVHLFTLFLKVNLKWIILKPVMIRPPRGRLSPSCTFIWFHIVQSRTFPLHSNRLNVLVFRGKTGTLHFCRPNDFQLFSSVIFRLCQLFFRENLGLFRS